MRTRFPRATASSGTKLDVNYWGIWLLKKVGLAREIKTAQYDPANPRPAGVA